MKRPTWILGDRHGGVAPEVWSRGSDRPQNGCAACTSVDWRNDAETITEHRCFLCNSRDDRHM